MPQILPVTTPSQRNAAFALRRRVFVEEQGVTRDEEFDALDETAEHVIALEDDHVIATGRLIVEDDGRQVGRIGRMAVAPEARGSGIGRGILETLMNLARERGMRTIVLHAQTQALGFYEKAGFETEGPEFEEARIPHRKMIRSL